MVRYNVNFRSHSIKFVKSLRSTPRLHFHPITVILPHPSSSGRNSLPPREIKVEFPFQPTAQSLQSELCFLPSPLTHPQLPTDLTNLANTTFILYCATQCSFNWHFTSNQLQLIPSCCRVDRICSII